jgi:hypothetical protein
LFIAALVGVGVTFAWDGDEAKGMIRTWAPSLSLLSSISTTDLPPYVDIAAEQTGSAPAGQLSAQEVLPPSVVIPTAQELTAGTSYSELVQRIEAITRTLAVVQDSVEQLAAKQEQIADDIPRLRAVEQNIRQKKVSSPPLSQAVSMPPRKKTPRPAPLAPTVQPSPEHPLAEQLSAGPSSPEVRPEIIPRPPLPLRDE